MSGPDVMIQKAELPFPTQFRSFELIGWNIKAVGLETPRYYDVEAPWPPPSASGYILIHFSN